MPCRSMAGRGFLSGIVVNPLVFDVFVFSTSDWHKGRMYAVDLFVQHGQRQAWLPEGFSVPQEPAIHTRDICAIKR